MLTGAAQVTVLMLPKKQPRISKAFKTPQQSGVQGGIVCVSVLAKGLPLHACEISFLDKGKIIWLVHLRKLIKGHDTGTHWAPAVVSADTPLGNRRRNQIRLGYIKKQKSI